MLSIDSALLDPPRVGKQTLCKDAVAGINFKASAAIVAIGIGLPDLKYYWYDNYNKDQPSANLLLCGSVPSCNVASNKILDHQASQHEILLVVSNQPLLDPAKDAEDFAQGAHWDSVTWILEEKPCPAASPDAGGGI